MPDKKLNTGESTVNGTVAAFSTIVDKFDIYHRPFKSGELTPLLGKALFRYKAHPENTYLVLCDMFVGFRIVMEERVELLFFDNGFALGELSLDGGKVWTPFGILKDK